MARPQKKGFDYFNLDTDHFQDMKIKRLKKDHGAAGYAVYQYILNEIYRVDGCYIVWDESTAFDVSEYWGLKETHVSEIVRYCLAVGLFDKDLAERSKALPLSGSVLSSRSIQSRYIEMLRATKRRGCGIPEAYNLLGNLADGALEKTEKNRVSSEETPISSEETPISSEETPISSEESTQRKEKKSKEKPPKGGKKKVELSFSTPSLEEVDAYVRSEGLSMQTSEFIDYNEARGWEGVRDWKAACRRWASKEGVFGKKAGQHPLSGQRSSVPDYTEALQRRATVSQQEAFKARMQSYIDAYNSGKRTSSVVKSLQTAKRNGTLDECGLVWNEEL